MKDYLFRIEIDKVLRQMFSKSLNLSNNNGKGPDFKTKDCTYFIELKSRRINKDNEKNHFSLKRKQYKDYGEYPRQTVFSCSNQ